MGAYENALKEAPQETVYDHFLKARNEIVTMREQMLRLQRKIDGAVAEAKREREKKWQFIYDFDVGPTIERQAELDRKIEAYDELNKSCEKLKRSYWVGTATAFFAGMLMTAFLIAVALQVVETWFPELIQ